MSHWPVSLASWALFGHTFPTSLGQTVGNQSLGAPDPVPVSQSWVGSICFYEHVESTGNCWYFGYQLVLALWTSGSQSVVLGQRHPGLVRHANSQLHPPRHEAETLERGPASWVVTSPPGVQELLELGAGVETPALPLTCCTPSCKSLNFSDLFSHLRNGVHT